MSDFEIVKNPNLVTTRQESFPYLSDAIVLTSGGSTWLNGTKVEIIPAITVNELNTFTFNHAADVDGTLSISLDDVIYSVPIVAGSIASVCTQIRAANFGAYTTGGNGSTTVTFTRAGRRVVGSLAGAGGTGVTVSGVVKTATGNGIGDIFDIFRITPTAANTNTTYQITLWSGLAGYETRLCTTRLERLSAVGMGQPLEVQTPKLPAGTRISASIATLSGAGTETLGISIGCNVQSI